jgi:glucose/arabinose dehydrogenase/mono/diheme cytochrome c family protein
MEQVRSNREWTWALLMRSRFLVLGLLGLLLGLVVATPSPAILFYSFLPWNGAGKAPPRATRGVNAADVAVPPGYCVEVVVSGLTYPTGVVTDDQDRVYVVEAGYSYGEDFQVPRLLRIEANGQLTEVARGENNGPWTGISYHKGAFYVSEGGEMKGGRILKIAPDGKVAVLIDGIPSMGDHHTNRPVVGPDGSVYFGVGTFTNSGVVGPDNAKFGWLKRHPQACDVPPVDVVLAGRNFASFDKDTGEQKVTGAFVPYGIETQPGQMVTGRLPGSGAIHRIPPGGGKVELVAWGFRNPFGLAFGPDGDLYCTDNMYDERGSRPVYGAGDLLWKVQPGLWHGWPDYWGNIPLSHKRFSEKQKQGVPNPGFLLAQHPNCPPNPAARLGVRSSSDGIDFSHGPAFGHCGEAFIAVFGDITDPCQKVRRPVGCRVIRVNPCNGSIHDFVINKGKEAGPGSKEGNCGIERPVDCRFNNDGSVLYVTDFGVMTVDNCGNLHPQPGTGVIWRVRRTGGPCGDFCDACPSGPGGVGPAGYYRRGEAIGRPVSLGRASQARGEVVYMKNCYQCHQGGEGGLGPALLQLAPGPIVRTQIRAGLGVMPSFDHSEITNAEMNDLIAYIRVSRHAGPPYRPFR